MSLQSDAIQRNMNQANAVQCNSMQLSAIQIHSITSKCTALKSNKFQIPSSQGGAHIYLG